MQTHVTSNQNSSSLVHKRLLNSCKVAHLIPSLSPCLFFSSANFLSFFFFSQCCILRDDKYTHILQSGEECNSAEGLCFHQQFHQQGLHVSSSSPPSTSSSSPFRFELASVAVYCRNIPLFFLVATVKINDNMKGESVFTRTQHLYLEAEGDTEKENADANNAFLSPLAQTHGHACCS